MDENKPDFDLTVINPDIIRWHMPQYVSGPKAVNETNTFEVYNFLNGTHKSIEGLIFPFYHFVRVVDSSPGICSERSMERKCTVRADANR